MDKDVLALAMLAALLGAWLGTTSSDETACGGRVYVDDGVLLQDCEATRRLIAARQKLQALEYEAEVGAWCPRRMSEALAARRQGLAALETIVREHRLECGETLELLNCFFDDTLYNIRQATSLL